MNKSSLDSLDTSSSLSSNSTTSTFPTNQLIKEITDTFKFSPVSSSSVSSQVTSSGNAAVSPICSSSSFSPTKCKCNQEEASPVSISGSSLVNSSVVSSLSTVGYSTTHPTCTSRITISPTNSNMNQSSKDSSDMLSPASGSESSRFKPSVVSSLASLDCMMSSTSISSSTTEASLSSSSFYKDIRKEISSESSALSFGNRLSFNTSPSNHYPSFQSSNENSPKERVYSPSGIPFQLKQLSRSPRTILEKKSSRMGKLSRDNVSRRNNCEITEEELEMEKMTKLKLFYLEEIKKLEAQKKIQTKPVDCKIIVDACVKLEEELKNGRVEVVRTEAAKRKLSDQLIMTRNKIGSLQMVMQEEETRHFKHFAYFKRSLIRFPVKMSTNGRAPLFAKIFPPPGHKQPQPSNSGDLLQFSNLFCLSGQLIQFCQGQHGSKLVATRLREGTEHERNLVREELGLPGSLCLILETGNEYFKDVVMALVESDARTNMEVIGMLKCRDDVARIEGGLEFSQKVFSLKRFAFN